MRITINTTLPFEYAKKLEKIQKEQGISKASKLFQFLIDYYLNSNIQQQEQQSQYKQTNDDEVIVWE